MSKVPNDTNPMVIGKVKDIPNSSARRKGVMGFDPDLDEEVGLEQKVSLTIKATTVDQILVNLLARVRLTRDVREGHVWIRRKGSGDESP